MNKTWTEVEKQFLRTNALIMRDVDVVKKLGELRGKPISLQAVRKQRQKLGLLKASGRGLCRLRTPKQLVTNEISV